MTPKIITNNFILYGLNRYRNFLSAPNGEGYVELKNELEVIDFCSEKMVESGCDSPGMFAVFLDGTYMALTIIYEEDDTKILIGRRRDMHFFSEFDAAFYLHCYGLICEIKPGYWKVME